MLAAERAALNFLGHLSGIATADRDIRAAPAAHKTAHLLHAQDHAGAARAGEIRGALRRRLQSPLRPRRRDPDQGQPHRGRGRHPRRAGARARRTPAIWSRSRSRSIRSSSSRGARLPASPTWCCSTTWTSPTMREAVEMVAGRLVLEASGGITLETDRRRSPRPASITPRPARSRIPRRISTSRSISRC